MTCKACVSDTASLRAYTRESEGALYSVSDAAPLVLETVPRGVYLVWVVGGDASVSLGVSLRKTNIAFDFNGVGPTSTYSNQLSIVYARGDEFFAIAVLDENDGLAFQSSSGVLTVAVNKLPPACAAGIPL